MGGTYYQTSQEWLDQSMLLIQAQPETPTPPRIIPLPVNPSSDEIARHERRKRLADKRKDAAARARLVLKTYDPVTGCCLKYKTTKAAEVGRLISGMGRLGMGMAALPLDVPQEEGKKELEEAATGSSAAAAAASSKEGVTKEGQGGGKAGGGKKKKKGKK